MPGIYIHVPFCTAKCAYCDFYSVARPDMAQAYVEAVSREYAARAGELGGEKVRTIYLGGGTPSLLSPELFGRLTSPFDRSAVEEFTIEVNPDDIDGRRVDAWLAAGVNRVSIGIQSLQDKELAAVGRRHNAAQAIEAIALLHAKGITNISGDLIYGLPGQTLDSFADSLRRLIDTGITHLSAYCLSYEEGTRLWRKLQQGLVTPADDELIEAMYSALCRMAKASGFEHYEISNFALPGYRSRHNSAYWRDVPYLGLGPGAHSLDSQGIRRYVPADIRAYIAKPEEAATIDPEDSTDRANDRIMTSLRTAEGLTLADFTDAQQRQISKAAKPHIATGRLHATPAGYAIPEESFLLSDAIIRDLLL